ncbi:MAG: hypothetical protein IH831_05965, partial [Planctomycetes bacterium]|nr:hypothetical protein [Planctomycetota bacterium]
MRAIMGIKSAGAFTSSVFRRRFTAIKRWRKHKPRETQFNLEESAELTALLDLDSAARWEGELRGARAQAEAQGIARETERLDAELARALQEQQAAQQRINQQESIRIDLDRRASEQEQQQRAQEAALELRLRELQVLHQQELENMRSMDDLSIHALIAVAPGEKAPLLAELARTEALKSFSPEQILAIASEKSPELGNALAEMAIRGDNQQTNEMYERLISQQKEFTDDQRKSQGEMTQIMLQMFNKALDTNAQVASSF